MKINKIRNYKTGKGVGRRIKMIRKEECKIKYLYLDQNLYDPVRNAFIRPKSISRVSVSGLGRGYRYFFRPCEMASSR